LKDKRKRQRVISKNLFAGTDDEKGKDVEAKARDQG